jgi:hypothetical protein
MSKTAAQLRFAGSQLGETRHMYALFNSDEGITCTYQLGKFGGDTVVDILRTHPMVIIAGIPQQNPLFVPPQEFLRELRRRRAGHTARSAAV